MIKFRAYSVIITGCFFMMSFFYAGASQSEGTIGYKRTVEHYKVPNVTLVNQDGEKVSLKAILNSEKPVLLEFIFTTCKTICPVLAIEFSHFQKNMGPDAHSVQLVSISIDPDHDTPEAMIIKECIN